MFTAQADMSERNKRVTKEVEYNNVNVTMSHKRTEYTTNTAKTTMKEIKDRETRRARTRINQAAVQRTKDKRANVQQLIKCEPGQCTPTPRRRVTQNQLAKSTI